MTSTEGPEMFPANTAAYRAFQSAQGLVQQFMTPLIELEEQHEDLALSELATAHVNAISRTLFALQMAMSESTVLLTSNGRKAPGRDLDEEDRALRKALGELEELADDQKYDGHTYDDPSYYRQDGRISAGDDLSSLVKDVKSRLLRGRTKS